MKTSKSIIYGLAAVGIFFIIWYSMSGNEENYQFHLNNHRAKYEKSLLSGKNAPIQDRKKFTGLHFFPDSMKYIVQAKVEKFDEFKTVEMTTNLNEKRLYIYYATLHFELHNQKVSLVLFQNQQDVTEFFLPFTDKTTGNSTYPSGRYLDVKMNNTGFIELDFNKTYNPYCAYNHNFSCPIPPKENFLPIKIEAGEMNYKKM